MPHSIIKRVWDYCSYDKKFLLFVFALLFISSLIQNYVYANGNENDLTLLRILVFIIVSGYGMSITRSRINHGKRLPKIVIKDIVFLGIKAGITSSVYFFIQIIILAHVGFALGFHLLFDLEELLLNWSDTISILFYHEPVSAILFVVAGLVLFYVTTFFMEIALAKLADTGSLWASFNLMSIKRSIDVFGWKNYAKDCTLIILAIVILSNLISYNVPFTFIDSIIDMFLSFLIFVTQYLGIGAVYCKIKDLESGHVQI
ncbi:DUF4013 domain-containing protein [Methanobrevibacter sp.]|uniref:DUF4013 domain-containing protein n=1 Tax=Methanobrevibacter sp. TaxID=66852 RepID=UPI0025DC8FD3|nr:DUF4013 domain-containing protein [Methanobrevibacter sp.]MBR4447570.1 DUF4013 domain-containing protein [Methanobrevibacter sp.]